MMEFERESILFDRFEKRKELQEKKEQAIREGKYKETVKESKKTRSKGGNSTYNSALTEIGEKRNSKRRKEEEEEDESDFKEKKKKKYGSEDEDSDYKEDYKKKKYRNQREYKEEVYEEEEEEERRFKSHNKKIEEEEEENEEEEEEKNSMEATLQDLLRITLTRDRIEKLLKEEYFNLVIKSCFVRVLITTDQNSKPVYRLAEIDDVIEKSEYKLPSGNMTKKQLVLKIAGAKKNFRIEKVSNKLPSESEYIFFCEKAKSSKEKMITSYEINKRKNNMKKIIQEFVIDDHMINKKLMNKKKTTTKSISDELAEYRTNKILFIQNQKSMGNVNEEDYENNKEYQNILKKIKNLEGSLEIQEKDKSKVFENLVKKFIIY
jgi:hypothetical protein